MDDFDIAQSKIGDSVREIIALAREQARRFNQTLICDEHLLLAFMQADPDVFAAVAQEARTSKRLLKDDLVRALGRRETSRTRRGLKVSKQTARAFARADERTILSGRQFLELEDLFFALFDPRSGGDAMCRRLGIDTADVLRTRTRLRIEQIFGGQRNSMSISTREVLLEAWEAAVLRKHDLVTSDHVVLGLSRIRRRAFVDLVCRLGLKPTVLVDEVHNALDRQVKGRGYAVVPQTMRAVVRIAALRASRHGASRIEPAHLLASMLDRGEEVLAKPASAEGLETSTLSQRLEALRGTLATDWDGWRTRVRDLMRSFGADFRKSVSSELAKALVVALCTLIPLSHCRLEMGRRDVESIPPATIQGFRLDLGPTCSDLDGTVAEELGREMTDIG